MNQLTRVVTIFGALALLAGAVRADDKKIQKFARFQAGKTTAYGIVEGDQVRQLSGNLFGKWEKTDTVFPVKEVKLLVPVSNRQVQVLAMAGNYKSHLPGQEIAPKFKIPQVFFKSSSCLIAHGDNIVIPKGTNDVHYEGELVLVIGKRAKNVTKDKALEHILGVTCGNDVSARDWQKDDVQWWRAKGSDTFGPCGPVIVSGLNYDDLGLQLRLNGEVKQKTRTSELIHNCAAMVSAISQHLTLYPGDLIYTGTSGTTSAIKPGDVVEVEIEGIGVLRNTVAAAK